ncbi:helix-turn-helix domain-containing protein [Sulfitobacter pacificus]|uniref:Transcriptional regulator n=1 Tax=Sulfitobacter pacificus TaxID=1499314 RepID=A0ABQ5VJD4_9RHOB|nr:helix-turn-helix domain-containing protein [Sulfitobacter pacificus]GLQ27228.1 transcriptional regulator [Sulfitobacter pacificus]
MTNETDWYSPEAATFGDRVAAARERAGMSQGVLAKRLGVKLATLRAWEEDRSEPRANRLSILAGLLNVSMMWLINSEGEGIEAPQDVESLGEDMQTILTDIRLLRAEMLVNVENLGRLEKRLRLALEAPQHV